MAEFKDNAGQTYTSPDNRAAGNGVSVTLSDGSKGTMIGGTVVPNR